MKNTQTNHQSNNQEINAFTGREILARKARAWSRPWNMPIPQIQSNDQDHATKKLCFKEGFSLLDAFHLLVVCRHLVECRHLSFAWTVFASGITGSPQKAIGHRHKWSWNYSKKNSQRWPWTECFLLFSLWLVLFLSESRFLTCPPAKVTCLLLSRLLSRQIRPFASDSEKSGRLSTSLFLPSILHAR